MSSQTASVVIPAHDEGAVVDRCLSALLRDARPGEFEVVVAANGCTDDTVARARAHGPGVQVLDLPSPGKIGALNAGDGVATAFPRIYLDADVVLSTVTARQLVDALAGAAPRVGGARLDVDLSRASRWVRSYYRVWTALPVMTNSYVGSGVYAVSAEGHARLAPFPDVVADDHYARLSFAPHERVVVDGAVTIHPPLRLVGVIRRGVRVHAGNDALTPQRSPEGAALVVDEVPRGLRGALGAHAPAPDRAVYLAVTLVIRIAARLRAVRGRERVWSRDESSRTGR